MTFELRRQDLRISQMGPGSSTGAPRSGRIQITVVHAPTGLSATGETGPAPRGRTRAQSSAARDGLIDKLCGELADQVAARLRLPGRTPRRSGKRNR